MKRTSRDVTSHQKKKITANKSEEEQFIEDIYDNESPDSTSEIDDEDDKNDDPYIELIKEEKKKRKEEKILKAKQKNSIGALDDISDSTKRQKNSTTEIDDADYESPSADIDENEAKMEPFSMRNEMEEGRFDESGVYHLNPDTQTADDVWLQDVSPESIVSAKEAKDRRILLEKERIAKEMNDKDKYPKDKSVLLKMLLDYMQPGEVIARTLKRLAPPRVKGSRKWSAEFNAVSDIAEKLLNAGVEDIYTSSFAELSTLHEKLSALPQNSQDTKFVYKWEHDGPVFGPFKAEDMLEWYNQGYFSSESVQIKRYEKGQDFICLSALRKDDFSPENFFGVS